MAIDITIAALDDLTELPSLTFTAQPLYIEQSFGGNKKLVDVGNMSSITFPKMLLNNSLSEIIARPQIMAIIPAYADAVRVSVEGYGGQNKRFSAVLLLRDIPSSAVLAMAEGCNQQSNSSECYWFSGTCMETLCPKMCVSCNDLSPSLNCATCSMGCGGGGEGSNCTPSEQPPGACELIFN